MDRSSPPGRVIRASAAEVADVAVAQGALLTALLRARFRPTGQLVAPAPDAGGGGATADRIASEERQAVVARATRAIDRASRRGLFRPTCLVRSLALARLLERWGVREARIRIGLRRGAPAGVGTMAAGSPAGINFLSGGAPQPGRDSAPGRAPGRAPASAVRAHAWVELEGRVIGDDPRHVATFTPLGSVTSSSLRWR